MSSVNVLLDRLRKISEKQHNLNIELSSKIETKLGHGWGVDINACEGVVVVDPDGFNYESNNLAAYMKLSKSECIYMIKKQGCD